MASDDRMQAPYQPAGAHVASSSTMPRYEGWSSAPGAPSPQYNYALAPSSHPSVRLPPLSAIYPTPESVASDRPSYFTVPSTGGPQTMPRNIRHSPYETPRVISASYASSPYSQSAPPQWNGHGYSGAPQYAYPMHSPTELYPSHAFNQNPPHRYGSGHYQIPAQLSPHPGHQQLPSQAGKAKSYGAVGGHRQFSLGAIGTIGDEPKEGVKTKRTYRKKTPPSACLACGATDTPEWRKGPTGNRTLCNACGLQAQKHFPSAPRTEQEARDQLQALIDVRKTRKTPTGASGSTTASSSAPSRPSPVQLSAVLPIPLSAPPAASIPLPSTGSQSDDGHLEAAMGLSAMSKSPNGLQSRQSPKSMSAPAIVPPSTSSGIEAHSGRRESYASTGSASSLSVQLAPASSVVAFDPSSDLQQWPEQADGWFPSSAP